MMAKMFYTLDETKAALGKGDEEIKQLTREGRLREFRDGSKLMFKADQVEGLKSELGGKGTFDRVDLGPSDSGAPIGLVDSKNASGTSVTLTDTDMTGSGAGVTMKDDTAAGDLGLSGSVGGVPSPGRSGGSMSGTGGGVTVFRPDEVERADPSAQTAISGSMTDQINLEGVGSGSGLLDLTRESDDTSLGAELLDEIKPGATRGGGAVADTRAGMDITAGMPAGRVISAPVQIEAPDALAPAFGGAALAATLAVLFGGFVMTAAVTGYWPQMVKSLTDENPGGKGLMILSIGGLALAAVFFVVGLIFGRIGKR